MITKTTITNNIGDLEMQMKQPPIRIKKSADGVAPYASVGL